MSKQAFCVTGDFQMGRVRQTFRKELIADSEEHATELTFTDFGSRHGVGRRQINIESVKGITAKDMQDPVVRAQVE